jgi:hypothetical protein
VRIVCGLPQVTYYLPWDRLNVNLSYGDFPEGQLVYRARLIDPTPLAANTRRQLSIIINEWLATNTGNQPGSIRDPATGFGEDWFELYNAEFFPVDLGGFYTTDTLTDRTKSRVPSNGHYVIPAGGFLLVWADDVIGGNNVNHPDLHAAFKLSIGGEAIGLYYPDGITAVDSLTFGAQTVDVSEGRYGDGANQRFFMPRNTPRGPNSITAYNSPPRFPIIPDQFASPGFTLSTAVTATDADGHAITYTLDTAPPGSSVLTGGIFRWVVPAGQTYGNHTVTVRATDNGSPPRSATATFTVIVGSPYGPPPVIYEAANVNGQATFTFSASLGHTYRVLFTDDLTTPLWIPLDRDFVAANLSVSITDHLTVQKRFYRVQILD